MAAYHCLAVILGQAGLVKELINVIESMKEKPKRIKNMRRKNWSPELQPDIVIFNAVRAILAFSKRFFFCTSVWFNWLILRF